MNADISIVVGSMVDVFPVESAFCESQRQWHQQIKSITVRGYLPLQ